jgi:hypothetical protein
LLQPNVSITGKTEILVIKGQLLHDNNSRTGRVGILVSRGQSLHVNTTSLGRIGILVNFLHPEQSITVRLIIFLIDFLF